MNKKAILILAMVIILPLIAVGTAYLLRQKLPDNKFSLNKEAAPKLSKSELKKNAVALEDKGDAALKKGDVTTAKNDFTEAKTLYEKSGDDRSVLNVEAKLSLIKSGDSDSPKLSAPKVPGSGSRKE